MKRVLFFALSMAVCQAILAQKIKSSEVPEPVKAALTKAYAAKDAKWSKEEGNYEASFKHNGKEMSLVIDPSGKTIETETEISRNDLPAAAHQFIKEQYAGYKLEETARIVASGVTTYEAEVEKGEQSYDLIFDSGGKFLSKEAKEVHD